MRPPVEAAVAGNRWLAAALNTSRGATSVERHAFARSPIMNSVIAARALCRTAEPLSTPCGHATGALPPRFFLDKGKPTPYTVATQDRAVLEPLGETENARIGVLQGVTTPWDSSLV